MPPFSRAALRHGSHQSDICAAITSVICCSANVLPNRRAESKRVGSSPKLDAQKTHTDFIALIATLIILRALSEFSGFDKGFEAAPKHAFSVEGGVLHVVLHSRIAHDFLHDLVAIAARFVGGPRKDHDLSGF